MKKTNINRLLAAMLLFLLPFAVYSQEQKKEIQTVTFRSSMDCQGCVEKLTKALAFEKGVTDLEFDLGKNLITIEYKNWKTSPEKLKDRIVKTGYLAEEVREEKPAEGQG